MKQHSPLRHSLLAAFCFAVPVCALCPAALSAQDGKGDHTSATQTTSKQPDPGSVEYYKHFVANSFDREYKLHYASSAPQANEILTAIRNAIEPVAKIFLVPSSNTIVVHAPEETQTQIAHLLAALDQPRPRYLLTYTLSEMDGGRKLGVQHYSMVVLSGERTELNQGSRIPVASGSSGSGAANVFTQFTYVDVGMHFDVTLTGVEGGGVLKSKVEQNSVAPNDTASVPQPIVRHTLLEGTTSLVNGKPLVIGSIDIPSSTRHIDVEVEMEPVK